MDELLIDNGVVGGELPKETLMIHTRLLLNLLNLLTQQSMIYLEDGRLLAELTHRPNETLDLVLDLLHPKLGVVHRHLNIPDFLLKGTHLDPENINVGLVDLHIILHIFQTVVEGLVGLLLSVRADCLATYKLV
jgi:hypothetical protein